MIVSRSHWEKLGDIVAKTAGNTFLERLATALCFPNGTSIRGILDEPGAANVAIKIESPLFPEVPPGSLVPQVEAIYGWDKTGKPTFGCWLGEAVGIPVGRAAMTGPLWLDYEAKATTEESGCKRIRFREFL